MNGKICLPLWEARLEHTSQKFLKFVKISLGSLPLSYKVLRFFFWVRIFGIIRYEPLSEAISFQCLQSCSINFITEFIYTFFFKINWFLVSNASMFTNIDFKVSLPSISETCEVLWSCTKWIYRTERSLGRRVQTSRVSYAINFGLERVGTGLRAQNECATGLVFPSPIVIFRNWRLMLSNKCCMTTDNYALSPEFSTTKDTLRFVVNKTANANISFQQLKFLVCAFVC